MSLVTTIAEDSPCCTTWGPFHLNGECILRWRGERGGAGVHRAELPGAVFAETWDTALLKDAVGVCEGKDPEILTAERSSDNWRSTLAFQEPGVGWASWRVDCMVGLAAAATNDPACIMLRCQL